MSENFEHSGPDGSDPGKIGGLARRSLLEFAAMDAIEGRLRRISQKYRVLCDSPAEMPDSDEESAR